MAHVEFLDGRDPTRPGDAPVEMLEPPQVPQVSPRWSARLALARVMVPALLAVAAIVLVMVAPWQRLFEFSDQVDGDQPGSVGTDGWGRFFDADQPTDQHLTRFGIVLCVAAGLLLAGAGLRVFAALRARPHWEQVGSWTVGAAIGVLGGTLASAALEADTYFDALEGQRVAQENGGAQLDGFDHGIHLGGMLYLGFGGMALALLALVAPMLLDRLLALPAHPEAIDVRPPVLAAPSSVIGPPANDPRGSAPTGQSYEARLAGPRGEDETLG